MIDVLTGSRVEVEVVVMVVGLRGVYGGSLPGQQAFPACEATAAKRGGGGRVETKPSMRYVGGVMIKTRKEEGRKKNVKKWKT